MTTPHTTIPFDDFRDRRWVVSPSGDRTGRRPMPHVAELLKDHAVAGGSLPALLDGCLA